MLFSPWCGALRWAASLQRGEPLVPAGVLLLTSQLSWDVVTEVLNLSLTHSEPWATPSPGAVRAQEAWH
jgi:hypothetical protein